MPSRYFKKDVFAVERGIVHYDGAAFLQKRNELEFKPFFKKLIFRVFAVKFFRNYFSILQPCNQIYSKCFSSENLTENFYPTLGICSVPRIMLVKTRFIDIYKSLWVYWGNFVQIFASLLFVRFVIGFSFFLPVYPNFFNAVDIDWLVTPSAIAISV